MTDKKSTPITAANTDKVFDLLAYLKMAYELYITEKIKEADPLEFVDAFMAVHNFHRMVIDDLVERTGNEALRQAAVETFRVGMLHRDEVEGSVPVTFEDIDWE